MRPSWLFAMAVGGEAASTLSGGVGISISDRVLSLCILYHNQLPSTGYYCQDGASRVREFSDNTAPIGLEAVQPNRTKAKVDDHPRESQRSDHHEDALRVITLRPVHHRSETNGPRQPQNQPPQQAKSPSAEYDRDRDPGREPDPGPAGASSPGTDTGDPALANRAIAGMSVGLLSVMVIFTVFL